MAPEDTRVTARSSWGVSDAGEDRALCAGVGGLDSVVDTTGSFSLSASSADGLSTSIGSTEGATSCVVLGGAGDVVSETERMASDVSAGGVGGLETSGPLGAKVGSVAGAASPVADGGVVDAACGVGGDGRSCGCGNFASFAS